MIHAQFVEGMFSQLLSDSLIKSSSKQDIHLSIKDRFLYEGNLYEGKSRSGKL